LIIKILFFALSQIPYLYSTMPFAYPFTPFPAHTVTRAVLYLLLCLVLCACQKEQAALVTDANKDTLLVLSYGPSPRQVFDLSLPAQRDTSSPVIVLIHGGAWKAGQKEDMKVYVDLLRSKWPEAAIANMNYRLASNTNAIHHNEIMADIDSVVSHLVRNKVSYRISSKMGMMGASAGAQLSMIYAYRYNSTGAVRCVSSIFGPSILRDWSWYNSTNIWLGGYVGDILAEYVGQPWDTLVYGQVSPFYEVKAGSPPSILFHGSLDPIVPVYQSQWMHARLDSLQVPNAYHEYFAFQSFDAAQNEDAVNKTVQFFRNYLP